MIRPQLPYPIMPDPLWNGNWLVQLEFVAYLIAVQYFRHATMGNSELSTDHTRPDSGRGQFHYLQADMVGQWTPVDEHAA